MIRQTLTPLAVLTVLALPVRPAGMGLAQPPVGPAGPPVTLRYQLQPGDHLVYREHLVRETTTDESRIQTSTDWTTHVLVAAPSQAGVIVGFQRNRTGGQLLRRIERGRDRTAAERPAFEEQLRGRRPIFAEANLIDRTGAGLLPWSVAREWRSPLLTGLHEIEPVPGQPIARGSTWTGATSLQFQMTATACPDGSDADCVLLGGASDLGRLQVWFSRDRGLATRIAVDADYSMPPSARVREQVTFELAERRRGESPDQWLDAAETREGELAGLQVAETTPVPAARLYRLLAVDDEEVQRQVLALAWSRSLAPPPAEVRPRLLASSNPRIRALAALFEAQPPAAAAASASVTRAGTTPAGAWAGPARATACDGAVAEWRRGRTLLRQPPGATLRAMTAPGFEGWPFVIRVPDEYRPDRPVPLVVYLGGGPGLAVQTAQLTEPAFAATGYLVLFPHAAGLWWEERPRQMVNALIDEVMREFDVDTNRVYLAGFSNGGTGSLLYSMLWPQRFAAVAATMAATVGPGRTVAAYPSALASVPVLLVHGTKDPVIPPDEAEENRRRLTRGHRVAPFDLALMEGRVHDIWVGADEGRTLAFLSGRERDAVPRAVTAEMDDLAYPRRYWVEIVEKDGGVARAEAQVGDDGSIDVTTRNVRRLWLLLRRELLPARGPLVVRLNGREAFRGSPTPDCGLFARTLAQSADPQLAYSVVVELNAGRQ